MINSTRRASYTDVHSKNEANSGDGFGNEIERMLMDRPTTRQANCIPASSANTGGATNTLDELMAELGMLRGDRGELARNGTRMGPRISSGDGGLLGIGPDVALRPITPRVSMAAAAGPGVSLNASTVASTSSSGPLMLPPAKGAMPAPPYTASGATASGATAAAATAATVTAGGGVTAGGSQLSGGGGTFGSPYGRAPSPMSTRRSVPGVMTTQSSALGAFPSQVLGGGGTSVPSAGALERQALLEMRLEKMEAREHQLMALVAQLQHQVSTLSRAQQTTQQQLLALTAPPSPTSSLPAPASPLRSSTGDNTTSNTPQPTQDPDAPASLAPQPAPSTIATTSTNGTTSTKNNAHTTTTTSTSQQQLELASEEGLSAGCNPDDGMVACCPANNKGGDISPRQQQQRSQGGSRPSLSPHPPTPSPPGGVGAPQALQGGAGQQQRLVGVTPPPQVPSPPASSPPPGSSGRPMGNVNKLVPSSGPPAEWEADVSQLRKEVGVLATNVVRLREQLNTLVPGGASPLSEEVAAQAAGAEQLKQNLTQIAMDVVSLHKGLTTLKQNSERAHTSLEKSITDIQLQAQTNALNLLASGAHQVGQNFDDPAAAYGAADGGNAVTSALASTGGVSGTLEESLRAAFARPAMRSVPAFNPAAELGFMPDNAGGAAAVAAFSGTGGGGGRMDPHAGGAGGAGGGGLGAAWALLNSFEEQAAAEKEEQRRAAAIARQAVSIVDAKVKQVVMHVDRHMHIISDDVEERLRMYEQTIIRMAQQIDRLQRLLRDMDEAGPPRLVVQRGGASEGDATESEAAAAGVRRGSPPAPPYEQAGSPDAGSGAKANWMKAAAMATGRFVPRKEEDKKPVTRAPHGYFRAPP